MDKEKEDYFKRKIMRVMKENFGDIGVEIFGYHSGNSSDDKNRKILKSVPAKEKWVKKMEDIEKRHKVMESEHKKVHLESKAIWAEIHLELNDVSDIKYNKESKEIEILDEGEGLIKSPINL